MKAYTKYTYPFLFSILFVTTPAFAQISSPPMLEFALAVKNQDAEVKFSDSSLYKTRLHQLGINWYEPVTTYFHGGLEMGYMEMTQIDNPLASAQFTSGEYIGLLLRFIPLQTEHFSLLLNLNYRYSQSRGSATDQSTQFAWDETVFSTELKYQATHRIGFQLGADFQVLNGEQRDSGTVTKITEFSESRQENIRFGVNFNSNRNGVVGIETSTGFKSGIRLYFVRKF